jgi:hypothetical protein
MHDFCFPVVKEKLHKEQPLPRNVPFRPLSVSLSVSLSFPVPVLDAFALALASNAGAGGVTNNICLKSVLSQYVVARRAE